MKEIEVYLHGIGHENVKIVRVGEESTIAEIIRLAKQSGLIGDATEELIEIFIGDSDEPAHKGYLLHHLGIKHRSHLICHHCKKIKVFVSYNGAQNSEHFAPNIKVAVVLKWAIRAFGISTTDAVDMVLRMEGTKNDLSTDERIGSLVHPPHCELKLYLVHKTRVEG